MLMTVGGQHTWCLWLLEGDETDACLSDASVLWPDGSAAQYPIWRMGYWTFLSHDPQGERVVSVLGTSGYERGEEAVVFIILRNYGFTLSRCKPAV